MRGRLVVFVLIAVAVAAAGCSSKAPTSVGTSTPASPTISVSVSASPLSPLVGQWELKLTCQAIVSALTKAGLQDLIPQDVGNTIKGWPEDGSVPAWWDPSHPCAQAKPIEHSHTFWADGSFNSYDENGNEVDNDHYQLVDDRTFRFQYIAMQYSVTGDSLKMDVVMPKNCTAKRIVGVDDEGNPVRCRDLLGWAFSVALPGQVWTRVTSGPHVPPGTGSSG
jgi:hypothetical protein